MLKSTLLLSCLFLFTFSTVFSQDLVVQKPESNVPAPISAAFAKKFPTSEPVWFSDYQGKYNQQLVYEGRFMYKNRNTSVIYEANGNLIATVVRVDQKELPKKIVAYMNEKFPSFPIRDAALVTAQNNETTYEVGIIINETYVIKVFSEEGDFIKSTIG
jgi:hypothetical protein